MATLIRPSALDLDLDTWEAWANSVEEALTTINEVLNDAATTAELCRRYETALDDANRAQNLIVLNGRSRRYTARIYLDVSITADDQGHAEDLAHQAACVLVGRGIDNAVTDRNGDLQAAGYEASDFVVYSVEADND